MTSLRASVYRGGGYLAFRQGAGLLLSAGGVLLLTRLLGPAAYGLYAGALALQLSAQMLAGWGAGTYLVRHEGDDAPERYHEVLTFLLVAGFAVIALGVLALPLAERWSRMDELTWPTIALFAVLPVQLMGSVPQAKVERALDFRSVARVELIGQVVFFIVSIGLAVLHAGVWAPVSAYIAQQTIQALGYFIAAQYRPRWHWNAHTNRAVLGFGSGYSLSLWIWQQRRLVNPMVVGRYLGAESVGYVAVATQIASQLSFVAAAAWRLSTAALARLQDDAARTAAAITEGMQLQALAVGPLLVAFGWLGSWLVPVFFGEAWAPLMRVYPAIALAFLTSSVFLLHSSALYVRKRTWSVLVFHLVNLALLGGIAVVLVPRIGLIGYAYAEVGALASYAVVHALLARHVAGLGYERVAVIWAAFAVALMLPVSGLGLGLGLGLMVLLAGLPSTRTLVRGVWQEMRGHAYGA